MASSTFPLQIMSSRGNWMPVMFGVSSFHVKSWGDGAVCNKCAIDPAPFRKVAAAGRSRSRLGTARAAMDDDDDDGRSSSSAALEIEKQKSENAKGINSGEDNSGEDKKAASRAEIQRGRNTAIITGAISVLLGVGYLVLIQLLDTRGIELIPPPPELSILRQPVLSCRMDQRYDNSFFLALDSTARNLKLECVYYDGLSVTISTGGQETTASGVLERIAALAMQNVRIALPPSLQDVEVSLLSGTASLSCTLNSVQVSEVDVRQTGSTGGNLPV
ncbi:hypothetical protein R1sor_012196 [Riccia sorocarpa]|uniref:Late embryogenesis abundant protein LEA-2 subgroup domain-containing protein n=1 Tax=Riccia sorocarpa TaxID=122646 RepID=A0ABD3I6X0_9MARC